MERYLRLLDAHSETWISNVIADIAGAHGLSASVMGSTDEADNDSIRRLALYFFGTHPSENSPRPCLDKVCVKKFLLDRAATLGTRQETLIKRGGLNKDNMLNWIKASPTHSHGRTRKPRSSGTT